MSVLQQKNVKWGELYTRPQVEGGNIFSRKKQNADYNSFLRLKHACFHYKFYSDINIIDILQESHSTFKERHFEFTNMQFPFFVKKKDEKLCIEREFNVSFLAGQNSCLMLKSWNGTSEEHFISVLILFKKRSLDLNTMHQIELFAAIKINQRLAVQIL